RATTKIGGGRTYHVGRGDEGSDRSQAGRTTIGFGSHRSTGVRGIDIERAVSGGGAGTIAVGLDRGAGTDVGGRRGFIGRGAFSTGGRAANGNADRRRHRLAGDGR